MYPDFFFFFNLSLIWYFKQYSSGWGDGLWLGQLAGEGEALFPRQVM